MNDPNPSMMLEVLDLQGSVWFAWARLSFDVYNKKGVTDDQRQYDTRVI